LEIRDLNLNFSPIAIAFWINIACSILFNFCNWWHRDGRNFYL